MTTATKDAEPVTADDDRAVELDGDHAAKLAECVELLKGAPQEDLDVLIPLIERQLRAEDAPQRVEADADDDDDQGDLEDKRYATIGRTTHRLYSSDLGTDDLDAIALIVDGMTDR